MTSQRPHHPSPLAGEGGEDHPDRRFAPSRRRLRSEPGEGESRLLGISRMPPPVALRATPSPASGGGMGRGRSASPSPLAGEGEDRELSASLPPPNEALR
jgi:hypothetical protein